LSVMARKNLMMDEKLTHLTKRTTREKLLSYLSSESRRQGSASFEIPYNRQQLADYLSVDRSAMTSELSRMRDEGLLTFEKNRFRLLI
ncbi:MAG TPA: helix-turn-helix domain-containing protein, partial [Bacillota bacterium]|nr:helix-turn-helix domain-containing protein [Bacillota bacterium]